MNALPHARLVIGILAALHALGGSTFAQPYTIEWHAIGPSAASAGGEYSLEGAIIEEGAAPMSGGDLTLDGGFLDLDDAGAVPDLVFDNTPRPFNSLAILYSSSIRTASRFCVTNQSYSLDSITLFLTTRSSPEHPTLRLQIYSSDPVNAKPLTDLGVTMNLSGATNPVTFVLASGSYETPFKWIPATPLALVAGGCYWAVLTVEGGEVLQPLSTPQPSGGIGFGRSQSLDGGALWGSVDETSNGKMQVRATPAMPPLAIAATRNGTDLRVSFPSAAAVGYTVQFRNELSSGSWLTRPGATVTGTGNSIEVIIPIDSSRAGEFFRIMAVP
jgi:hypothetical protein